MDDGLLWFQRLYWSSLDGSHGAAYDTGRLSAWIACGVLWLSCGCSTSTLANIHERKVSLAAVSVAAIHKLELY